MIDWKNYGWKFWKNRKPTPQKQWDIATTLADQILKKLNEYIESFEELEENLKVESL